MLVTALLCPFLLSSSIGVAHNNLKILYVVTDEYDEIYLEGFFKMYSSFAGDTISLDEIAGVDLGLYDVVVLVDPNWLDVEKAREAAEEVLGYVVGGGNVVATLNGVALLSLSNLWRSVAVAESVDGDVDGLYGYNVSKYRFIQIESPLLLYRDKFLSVLRVGEGYTICIPLNIVWAYADTKDRIYLDILAKSLDVVASTKLVSSGPRYERVVAAVAIAFTATLAENVGSLKESAKTRGKPVRVVVSPLWSRISYEEVLSHPARRAILEKLSVAKAMTFSELMKAVNMPKAVLSWHLYVLEQHGLVKVCRLAKPRLTVVFVPDSEGIKKAEEIAGTSY